LTVDVLDGTQLEVVDEVPRTVGVVAENCTNTPTYTYTRLTALVRDYPGDPPG